PRPSGVSGLLEERLEIARQALSATGHLPSPDTLRTLAAVTFALPDDGHLLHVGSLSPRGTSAVRVMCSLPKREVKAYLERIGWKGDLGTALEMVSILCPHTTTGCLNLDIGATVEPALGIEHHARRATGVSSSVLARLCDLGIAARDKATALIA